MQESKAETKVCITTVYSLYNTLATKVIKYRCISE